MAFFLEADQLSHPDKPSLHLEKVYNQLFPHTTWETVPTFSFDGLAAWMPPVLGNSERIGLAYETWFHENISPFVLRFELPKHVSKIGMRLTLVDMIPEEIAFDPKKTNIFSNYMNPGDRFGGVVSAAIGILKPEFYLLPEPPGPSCFDVHMLKCMGVENNNKPKALIYFE